MKEAGFSVAPPLDLSDSRHYDFTDERLLEWCFHMIESNRFRSFLSEPPCTTFSPAAFPAVRSYAEPLGFDRTDPKTLLGNLLAFRSFLLLRHGRKYGRPCGKEQPRRSKMAWLDAWGKLKELGFLEAFIASCQFGSPHKKEFRFITYLLDVEELTTLCPGGHDHVRIEGSYTKKSAVYTWELAEHIARAFSCALRRVDLLEAEGHLDISGYESVVVNDVLLSSKWTKEKWWAWKRKSHINVLEAHGGLGMLSLVATRHQDCRFVGLLDSRVAKGALAKGRSSSLQLQKACKRSAAIQLGFGLYPGWAFAPTRLNVADDPTRMCDVRAPVGASVLVGLSQKAIQVLHSGQFARWAANWIRLVLLVSQCPVSVGADAIDPASRSSFGESEAFGECPCFPAWSYACMISVGFWTSPWLPAFWLFPCHGLDAHFAWLGFWAGKTLSVAVCVLGIFLLAGCLHKGKRSWPFWYFIWVVSSPLVAAMEPRSLLEKERALRRTGVELIPTRVARKETLTARAKLLSDFRIWLYGEHGVALSQLLTARPPDPEEICKWLTRYGQEMFLSGKAYGRFAETINAVASERPAIRKNLSPAWGLAFAWLADEPYEHHAALPLPVLLAMMSLAMIWGWPLEAPILGLTWSGILRIGEVLLANRGDLVLPCDALPGTFFALLRIRTPKTRGRAARHQAARIDPLDIIKLLTAVFARKAPEDKLWPYSAATLRKRFTALLHGLELPTKKSGSTRPFDLGSLRPGGATFLLLSTEDTELVRRRGRWVSPKVCEIYLQEVLYTTYTEKLKDSTKLRITQLSEAFERILRSAVHFLNSAIPPEVWYTLYQASDDEELGEVGTDG